MANIGNYTRALGSMAKDASVGAAKSLAYGLKGAMMSEAPGITGAYAFGKSLQKRANNGSSAPTPSSGGAPSASSSPAFGGFSQSVSLVAGQQKGNVINLEQVRQLRMLNNSVLDQTKIAKFQIDAAKRKDQFAEEVAREQAFRDDKLLDAINRIGTGGTSGNKKAANDLGIGVGSAVGDVITIAIGTMAGGLGKQLIPMLIPMLGKLLRDPRVLAALAIGVGGYLLYNKLTKPNPGSGGGADGPDAGRKPQGTPPGSSSRGGNGDVMRSSPVSSNLTDRMFRAEEDPRQGYLSTNPNSSAIGRGQMLKGTFDHVARMNNFTNSSGQRSTFEDLKRDPELQRAATNAYNMMNKKSLADFGLPINDATLYLAYHFGPAGAKAILTANDSDAIESVLGAAAIKANPDLFKRVRAVGALKQWAATKMGMANDTPGNARKPPPGGSWTKGPVNATAAVAITAFADTAAKATGGGGTKIDKEIVLPVHDRKLFDQQEKIAAAQGIKSSNGTKTASADKNEIALQTSIFKPLFTSNSDIIAKTNKTFLQQFRSTATNAFSQAITKGLFPRGFGISFDQASQDDNFRGQQLQKIFGTSNKVSSTATKLLGKQYGPMFAPLFDNLAQGYLEVGSRMAGKAIFQGIGGLDAKETQGIMGQVLGNYAAGNKKLAFEQLLFGASGGKESGTAIGAETLFAKYGFKDPAEGIAYFASALGEKATQPFSKLMGADDRSKSIIFDPRSQTYVYADNGRQATQSDINAAGLNYGGRTSQTPMFGPGLNNYGVVGGPGGVYNTTAGTGGNITGGITNNMLGGGSQYQQILTAKAGEGPTRAQAFGLTPQAQAAGGAELKARQDLQIRATVEIGNKQIDAQEKLAIEGAKREYDIASKLASNDQEQAAAQKTYDEALNASKTNTDRQNATDIIAKLDQVSGAGGSGSKMPGVKYDEKGNPISVRKSGQLFSQNVDPITGVVANDPMKDIGNFAFDMAKMAGIDKMTKNIKNPYAKMITNFAIQKGVNTAVDWALDKGGKFIMDKGADLVMSFFGLANGGVVSGPAGGYPVTLHGTEAVIPLKTDLASALGTDQQLSVLGDQTQLLTSIDKSLSAISGRTGSGSGTSFRGSGGTWDTGLGGSGTIGGLGNNFSNAAGLVGERRTVSNGVSKSPTTGDYVKAIATGLVKSYAIKTGISLAANALIPGLSSTMALAGAGGGISGGIAALQTGIGMAGNALGITSAWGTTAATTAANASYIASMGLAPTAAAGTGLGATIGGALSTAATTVGSALSSAGTFLVTNPVGWAILGALAIFTIFKKKKKPPPPKEPKFHAAIYVTGNNDINAIAPTSETTDYHAPPEVYKTLAYGILRAAFNAAKAAEAVTKVNPPFDYLYIKIESTKIALCWGTGAPNIASLSTSTTNEVKAWGPPDANTNLNAIVSEIIALITAEFKKVAGADLKKLDVAANSLQKRSLDSLSSGLIQDLKEGTTKLDPKISKGIYSNDVSESDRISALMNAASSHTPTTDSDTGGMKIWSMKDNAYVDNLNPGALLYDTQGRPVYDIPGTSAGLTREDFGGTDVVGVDRPANLFSTESSSSSSSASGQNTVVNAPNTNVDNSIVTNFYSSTSTSVDAIRFSSPG